MLIVRHAVLDDKESRFEVRDPDEEGYTAVIVHPWHRYEGTSYESHAVFLSVGAYHPDGGLKYEESGVECLCNIIVDREEFVQGILETFPELKRADDPA